ncbi:MAG: DUF86 domain-containing protein [Selenomonadaceae bacterium]|nr:DUF86 domain-containing protein [Selenomonadaceae bacterium]
MRGKQADLHRLFHMVEYCRKLQAVGEDAQTYENFIAEENYRLVDVSAFYIGQLGELSHGLSDEMKDRLSDIPWKQISDMSNQIIYDYENRDTKIIWGVVTEDSSALAERCLEVLRAENFDETEIV